MSPLHKLFPPKKSTQKINTPTNQYATDYYRHFEFCYVICSDLPCMFVSEKITVFIAICILQLTAFWVSARWHYTPPCFEGVVLSLKMGYRILTNTGMGQCIQQQGLCTAFTVASLGDLEGLEPIYR